MHYERLRLATDAGLGARARIGMLVLKTDQTLEYEASRIMSRVDGVTLHHARLFNDFEINRDTLMAMKPLLAPTAGLLPVEWAFKSIGYGCTSGSMVIGEQQVEREIRSVHARAAVTNPFSGGIAGLAALGCRRIGVLTPYMRAVNDGVVKALTARGLEVTAFASYEESDDNLVGKITVDEIIRASVALAQRTDVDGIFVSCTSLRTIDAIAAIEAASGKPATSSNHAMLWHMLRLAGINEPISGLGRLFELALAKQQAAAE
ncbi:MAG: Asp/Glu racemase [Hyphomicrobiaceae bacterium]